jgi:hypothetical protein
MLKMSTIVLMFICLIIGALIGYTAKTIAVFGENNKNTSAYQKYPRRTIVVQIEVSQQELLFDEMRKFADDQGFAIRIAPTTPTGVDYSIEMWRQDVMILAFNNSDPAMFRFSFFDTDSAILQPEFVLSSLEGELKNYINEIPNVMISEEK